MKIRLNKHFLDNRYSGMINLKTTPSRIAYVPKGDRNLPEYILTYNSSREFPWGNKSAKWLFSIPYVPARATDLKVENIEGFHSLDEVWLKYKNATMIFITKEKDNKFRKENKNTILDLEALCVEK